jgi:hydroxyacyl-ACP dehydratase HTD2-like protein with hotdog domain
MCRPFILYEARLAVERKKTQVNIRKTRDRAAPRKPVFKTLAKGMALPQLVKRPTTMSVFMYAAANWVYHRVHYDQDYARSVGLRHVVVHGTLQASYLVQMITDWLGENGTLKKLSFRHHLPAYPGDVLTCSGIIKDKRTEDGQRCLVLDLTIVNQDNEKTTSATATVYWQQPAQRP